ncbi:MAG: TIGR03545 family protein [Bdellovibrio sp.]
MTTQDKNTKKKSKGIIRWEAIIPFLIICFIVSLYFTLFFDTHLRRGLEWVGYKAVGAEVDIAKLETSFLKASLRIQGIEITDAEKPTHNSVTIGDIRFSMLWDALLRAKIVVNEAAVEQIAFDVQRKHPGKVKPPEPEPKSNQPGFAEKLKEQALKEAQEQAGQNVLGDVIAMLGGTGAESQLEKLKESLPSKKMLDTFDADLKAKQTNWDQRLKTLPQGKDIQALNERLNKIKYKDFKTPQELQTSLQELDKVAKDGDAMYKQVQATSDDLNKDLKNLESQYTAIEKQIKTDVKSLEQHFHIPQLDAKALSAAVFNHYLAPYKAKFFRYKAMADKYLPPNLLKKDKQEVTVVQAHPREKGISYEFSRANSYPLFWIKRTGVSSQAGTSPDAGNIKGEILDITSNQALVSRPTVASLAGDFPGKEILGFLIRLSLDNTKELSEIIYKLKVDSYPISGRDLVKTPEVQIMFNKANGSLNVEGKIIGLKNVSIALNNTFSKIDYSIAAKNEIADQILKAVFTGIPTVNLTVDGQGELPAIPLSINSNLGGELQKGFEKQIQAKINEAHQRIQAIVDQEIGKQKAQIDSQLKQLKTQLDNQVQKAQSQLNDQKKLAESKADQAKKDAEAQAKKQLDKEGQKAVDELKKRFGL